MKKISVVVPIYNTEKYLKRCIDSILNQSYTDFEVLLINDGSTDKSAQICEEYALKDKRVKVINKQNGGLSSARNVGIDNAQYDYICFVDSDDWLDTDLFSHCINILKENDCDIIDYQCVFTNEYKIVCQEDYKTKVIKNKEILREYLDYGQTGKAPFSMCRKLYKTYLFEGIRCPLGKVNEDIATNYKVLMKCKKIIKSNKVGYYYFQEGDSITRGSFKKRDLNLLDACRELITLTEEENYKDIRKLAEIKYYRSYFSLLTKMALYGIDDDVINKKEIIKNFTKELRKKYFFLLKSKMPISRKLMMTLLCINIKCLEIPFKIYKKIGQRKL